MKALPVLEDGMKFESKLLGGKTNKRYPSDERKIGLGNCKVSILS